MSVARQLRPKIKITTINIFTLLGEIMPEFKATTTRQRALDNAQGRAQEAIRDRQYTEYGYRGLDEIRQLQKTVARLEQQIKSLKEQIDDSEDWENFNPGGTI